ncbi:unannotated protein [freshwater metagenome]|uniref:Unannotated protein n=1 Tax=freshwater metagenome TaxID=449393 RepID=A0A6J6IBX7_9ZZZZ|nr:hypothetical protein [Actinomycetota bacterium]
MVRTRLIAILAILVLVSASGGIVLGGANSSAGAQTADPGSSAVAGSGQPIRIRAFGDAVTAGFGVFGDGTAMSFAQTIPCLPQNRLLNDRCSSNSTLGPGDRTVGPVYSADFGLNNGFSWAAQVASALGVVDYANYAVSGSEPRHWMNLTPDAAHPDDGYLHEQLLRLEADDPDLVLVTLGGSTLLLNAFGGAGLACVALDDAVTQASEFRGCIDSILNAQLLKQSLMAVYFDVLAQTPDSHIVASMYAVAFPALSLFEPWQTEAMTEAVNGQISAAVESVEAAGATWSERISVSVPAAGPNASASGSGPDVECQRSVFGWSLVRSSTVRRLFDCAGLPPVLDADMGVHPSRGGHQAYADGAIAVIAANDWFPTTSATP